MKFRNLLSRYKTRPVAVGYHPIVHTIMLGTIFVTMARSMSVPFLAIYMGEHMHVSYSMIGFILGAGPIAATIGGFIGGTLSDRIGRRKVMLGALYISSLVFIGFAYSSNLYFLLVLSIVMGLSGSFFDPVAKALIGDLTPPEKRVRVFSLRYMAVNIGFSIGPVAGALLGLTGSALPFLIAAIVYLLYSVTLQVMLTRFGIKKMEVRATERKSFTSALRVVRADVVLLFFILGGVLSTTVHGNMSVTLSQFLNQRFTDGVQLFAWLMSINGICVILFQIPITKWAEKRNPLRCVGYGSVLFALGQVGFAYSTNWVFFIVTMILFTIGEILVIPSEYVLLDRITPDGMRGTYYGTQTFTNLGNFLGPWLGGILLSAYGGSTLFLTMGVVAILSIFVFWRGQRLHYHRTGGMATSDTSVVSAS